VIEDHPPDVQLLRYALDLEGEEYELQVLKDGEEALRFVREQHSTDPNATPCVIVLDLHLPKVDGKEVLAAIKGIPELSHVRVAVLTSSVDPNEEHLVREIGVRLYRKKPIHLHEFEEVAKEILAICKDNALVIV
jgi:CheY-like chemotaxis protein